MTRIALSVVASLSLWASPAEAQVTVQQPVSNGISAQTTVSIPDRGEIVLGGVNTARSTRRSVGPVRFGSSSSRDLQGSRLSAGVYIHDLAAMDEALLSLGTPDGIDSPNRYIESLAVRHRSSLNKTVADEAAAIEASSAKAQRFERLAQAALERGNPSVARLHWQMAARYGSQAARRFLDTDAPQLAINKRPER